MRKWNIFPIIAALSLLLAAGAFAAGYDQQYGNAMQGASRGADLQNDTSRGAMDTQAAVPGRAEMGRRVLDRASKIIGMDVKNPQGESLGDIKDVVIDNKTGRVAYAVLGSGTIVGAGGKYFAIPWNALTFSADGKNLVLNIDKDRLKNAPGFDKNNWPDFANQQWGAEVYRYYGVTPYWQGQPDMSGMSGMSPSSSSSETSAGSSGY